MRPWVCAVWMALPMTLLAGSASAEKPRRARPRTTTTVAPRTVANPATDRRSNASAADSASRDAPAESGAKTPTAPSREPPSSAPVARPSSSSASSPGTARDSARAPDAEVADGKEGGPKQFKFSETDVEGRLRAPQLVYFLRRVRAEFAAGDLGHRSFFRELSETQREPPF